MSLLQPGQPDQNLELIRQTAHLAGVDLVGSVDLTALPPLPLGAPLPEFMKDYRSAVVMGIPFKAVGPEEIGHKVSKRIEAAALEVDELINDSGEWSFIIHTDDEIDSATRLGLISIKALAREAGLGWQGRSLLVINPDHGPLHRLIALLTNVDLPAGRPLPNRCGQCRACVDACPNGALTLTEFRDHPDSREEVLNVAACDGKCTACIRACPWLKKSATRSN